MRPHLLYVTEYVARGKKAKAEQLSEGTSSFPGEWETREGSVDMFLMYIA